MMPRTAHGTSVLRVRRRWPPMGASAVITISPFQGAECKIQGSTFTDGDRPDDERWGVTYGISNGAAIDGSGLICWCFSPDSTRPNTRCHVFYQVEGKGILEARRYWCEKREDRVGRVDISSGAYPKIRWSITRLCRSRRTLNGLYDIVGLKLMEFEDPKKSCVYIG